MAEALAPRGGAEGAGAKDGNCPGHTRARDGRRPARTSPHRQPGGAHGRGIEGRRAGNGRRAGPSDQSPLGAQTRHAAARRGRRVRRQRKHAHHVLQPALAGRALPAGTRLLLHGRPDGRGGFAVSHHAPASGAGEAQDAEGDAVAHYPASEGISSTEILTLVREARTSLRDIIEALPSSTRVGARLPDRPSALAAMHFPRTPADLESGRRRLAFEELLLTHCCSSGAGNGALSAPARRCSTARRS